MPDIKTLGLNDPETKSTDAISANLDILRSAFPDAFRDGGLDFDILRQLLGGAVDEREEKYGLNWHGKRRARQIALTPSTGTLLPFPDESLDWDKTQNLMIEGDNLDVLKLLQKSYAGRVKLVYIDPPYNNGGDFVYPDDFHDSIRNYLNLTGQTGDDGHKLSSNSESSGRFHTDWMNMLYPRLKVARTLLRNDGTIFVSIDDNEIANLKAIMNEVFGEENFEGHIHWRRRHNQPNDPTKMIGLVSEHILCYAKDKAAYKAAGVGKIPLTGNFSNPDGDPRGDWASKPWKTGSDQSGSRYRITTPTGRILDEEWMGEEATFAELLSDNRIIFPDRGDGPPRKKYFRYEREQEGQCATNWWSHEQFGHNQGASSLLEELFGQKNVFSNPKPVELLQGIISIGNARGSDIVLDFFAGSGTTAHALMLKNAEDGGARRFIMVQLPEVLDPGNRDQKLPAEYCGSLDKPANIAELTKERLRRAARKVKADTPGFNGDLGFRVFKLAPSNIRAWEPVASDLEGTLLANAEHLVPGRTGQDVLYELLLKLGLDLCVPIEQRQIAGKTVHSIGGGALIACLADDLNREVIESLATGVVSWWKELAPAADTRVVFKDSGFADDVAKANMAAILNQNGLLDMRSL